MGTTMSSTAGTRITEQPIHLHRAARPQPGAEPHGSASAERIAAAVQSAVARHAGRPGALLPLLHDVQDVLGYLPATAVAPIARALNLSRADVHGVISFYHHFRQQPPGRLLVQICQAEACQSMGSDALLAHAEQSLGCKQHETRADGAVTIEPVYCLGQCANSPAAMIGSTLAARLTPARFDALVAAAMESGT
jgi:formate dehydrogenase subunit gamma